jgi:hypothetical protein
MATMPRGFLVARRPPGAPTGYIAVRNPRAPVARGKEDLARGLAFDAGRLPGETADLERALRAWVLHDTRETEAALCAVLAGQGVADPAAWIDRVRAAQDMPRRW